LAADKLSGAVLSPEKKALVDAAKTALADPTKLKASDIVNLRENNLKNDIMGSVQQAEALLAKA